MDAAVVAARRGLFAEIKFKFPSSVPAPADNMAGFSFSAAFWQIKSLAAEGVEGFGLAIGQFGR